LRNIHLWFLPYAIACGNTIVLKPSEKVPMTMSLIFQLIDQIGLPRGVANLVHGSREVTELLVDHPNVRAISFVGSSQVAKAVYSRAAAKGKRVQCQGGAKNMAIVLPDADMEMTTKVLTESAFGCAGQRCLAASVAITVGEARKTFTKQIVDMAASLKVGYGLESGVEMGPVITALSKNRIQKLISQSASENGEILLDGRDPIIPGYEQGSFVRPTIVNRANLSGVLAQSEIFGPVLALSHADSIEEAIRQANASTYGNMASLFTRDGHAARKFRYEVEAGNVGINVGVAAPMAFFPFSGWKDSFFGDLHAQGRDAIDFFTEKKIVVER
jgi:malonate-semialdehyde dehydrogenase (acetylating)/methylmalonate-semialdehyde dehydrogenase